MGTSREESQQNTSTVKQREDWGSKVKTWRMVKNRKMKLGGWLTQCEGCTNNLYGDMLFQPKRDFIKRSQQNKSGKPFACEELKMQNSKDDF